jgi:hypothetical protein
MRVDAIDGLLQLCRGIRGILCRIRLAARYCRAPQVLNGVIQIFARLFFKNLAQQHSKRTHIAAKRSFFQLTGRSKQL